MLILGRRDVERALDLDELIDALAPAMADLSAGRASVPLRVASLVAERDAMLAGMLAYVPSLDALAAKLVTQFPHNDPQVAPSHQAVVAAFDPATGAVEAIMDGTSITALRTAAGSALATRLLARADARVCAILGTGVQAAAHARAVARVRALAEIRIAGRDRDKAEALARALADQGLPARAAASFDAAFDGADIVCATTHAEEPVVRRELVAPGTHVNSVGYNAAGREVDVATVADALVAVEWRAAALAPPPSGSPDLRRAIDEGAVTEAHFDTEIGELVSGTRQGRSFDAQITLYKSVGVAVQDAVAAALVLRAARAQGLGRSLDL